MNEAGKSAWCREHGLYPAELEQWRASCTAALASPEEVRASPQATRQDRKRIKELERDLLRKDRALAETAALLPKTSCKRTPTARGCARPARWLALICAPCSVGKPTEG